MLKGRPQKKTLAFGMNEQQFFHLTPANRTLTPGTPPGTPSIHHLDTAPSPQKPDRSRLARWMSRDWRRTRGRTRRTRPTFTREFARWVRKGRAKLVGSGGGNSTRNLARVRPTPATGGLKEAFVTYRHELPASNLKAMASQNPELLSNGVTLQTQDGGGGKGTVDDWIVKGLLVALQGCEVFLQHPSTYIDIGTMYIYWFQDSSTKTRNVMWDTT